MGAATWKGEDSGEQFKLRIVNSKGEDIGIFLQGIKKQFRYVNPTLPEQNGGWIMHEYSLPTESPNWVLYRLHKNCRHNPIEVKTSQTVNNPTTT